MMEERVDKWCPNHHSPCGITMVESNWQRFFIGVSIPNVTQVKPTDNVLWFFLQMAETIIMITLFKIMDKWMWWRTLWLPNFKGRLRARVVNQASVVSVRWDIVSKLEDIPLKPSSWSYPLRLPLIFFLSFFYILFSPCNGDEKFHVIQTYHCLQNFNIIFISLFCANSCFNVS
mgnify:CR=1 FL=1